MDFVDRLDNEEYMTYQTRANEIAADRLRALANIIDGRVERSPFALSNPGRFVLDFEMPREDLDKGTSQSFKITIAYPMGG